ncbi:FkbM family methyltransferase [Aestuariivita boseongensis]|uniref:FkbM family methyltransferase n=1 Tax=Aestuariivita boseongensis TaxID=1470562 RepID=UPI000682B638|nr:FkbM family methyltransferase [Aestuariivita boseongensis]
MPEDMQNPDHVATCLGVKVPPSPFLSEMRINRINKARYEGDEIAGALSVVTDTDRVLEMGSGLGIVGAVIAANRMPQKVLSFEANPNLIPHILSLYDLNGLNDRISVRNEVVLSAAERPDPIEFHLANSFLGSSLLTPKRGVKQAVQIPTVSFDDVRKEFSPTVLVMDIEGGELEFLRDADLDGIRAIVIEFHPGVYGVEGMRTCKQILNKAGFQKVSGVSTRFVWTAVRDLAAIDAGQDDGAEIGRPLPDGGWSESLQTVRNAIVVPPQTSAFVQPAGILHSNGDYCPEGALWRKSRPLTTRPDRPEGPLTRLEGKWLWGGVLWQNFAHFMAESTTRLWALSHINQDEFRGILFIPKRPRLAGASRDLQTAFFDMMGNRLPVTSLEDPVEVEELVVPGQGFGLGAISSGTASYRKAVRENFASDVAPQGGEKLYISRSALGLQRGNLIGEHKLEALLEEQGYEIYHPQKHPIEAQVARYKAAKQIIAAEGSALHVFAFVAREDQKLAMIIRRWSYATTLIEAHLLGFGGLQPVVIDALSRNWTLKANAAKRNSLGELDFPSLQEKLVAEGFITVGDPWENLPEDEVRERVGSKYEPSDAS